MTDNELDQPEPDGYSLVMPFVVTESHGGPFADVPFVAGYECGAIDARLAVIAAAEGESFSATVQSANVPQLELIAMRHGFNRTEAHVDTLYPEWTVWRCWRSGGDEWSEQVSGSKPQTGSQGPLDGCAHAAAADSTGRPPRADAGASLVSGEYDEAAAHHDAMLREIESLRFQLAEAREALVRVAKTLGWDAPPEQVPSGVPDLTIAVHELRRQRDQARTVLAEARQQRDQAAEALVQAETERDEARDAQVQHAIAMAAIDAEIIDDLRAVLALSPGQSLTKAVTQLRDDLAWLRRQVLAVAEDLERYASDLRPEKLPMSERKLAWTLRQIVAASTRARRRHRR